MHKTKGSSIENVVVVLDENFWNKYNFKTIFEDEPTDPKERDRRLKSLKLAYVAFSRARTNLVCIRIITPEEENNIVKFFPDMQKI